MRRSVVNADEDVKTFSKLVREGKEPICFDVETTGLNAVKDRILTLSAEKFAYVDGKFVETDRMDIHLDPQMHIPESASKVNGIYDEDVKGLPTEEEMIKDIEAFFGDDPLICGYNSGFDINFMESMYNRQLFKYFPYCFHLDIMKMVKQKLELPNNKLSTAAHELGADIGMEAHRSIDDVTMTWRVFKLLLPYYKEEKKKPVSISRVCVTGARHWQKSHTCNFLFLDTSPRAKVSYNIYKREWKCDDGIDLDNAISQTFDIYDVDNEAELVKAVVGK